MTDPTSPPRETMIRASTPGLEFRDAGQQDLGPGYLGLLRVLFSPVNEWTEINSSWEGNFLERFAPGAWSKTIRESRDKIRALFQHGMDPQIGDKPLGPIRALEEGADGGYGEVALLDTSYNRDLLPGLRDGLYGASHRFSVMREQTVDQPAPSEHNPRGLPERTIKEARLMEFGPVTFPAYAGATAGMRSMTDDFLMRCFERDPRRLRAMFEAHALRMDTEDMGTLAEMIACGTTYIEEQDEAEDQANIPKMQSVLAALTDLMVVEASETEPLNEAEDDGGRAASKAGAKRTGVAPSESDAETDRSHLTDERRETTPPTKRPIYGQRRKETPSWLLGPSKSTKQT